MTVPQKLKIISNDFSTLIKSLEGKTKEEQKRTTSVLEKMTNFWSVGKDRKLVLMKKPVQLKEDDQTSAATSGMTIPRKNLLRGKPKFMNVTTNLYYQKKPAKKLY